MPDNKRYIGDGAYVKFDGWDFVLTTENGIEVTNTVHLEFDVALHLVEYIAEHQPHIVKHVAERMAKS